MLSKDHYKKIDYSKDQSKRKYSVLILLVENDNQINILFEVRSRNLNVNAQPGDISLPGGLCESDDIIGEVLRETFEEVGITPDNIEILGKMNAMYTGDERCIIPVVGYTSNINIKNLNINFDEVEEIFLVPLNFFIENNPQIFNVKYTPEFDSAFPFEKIMNGKNYKWRERSENIFFYYYKDYNVWGITAKIINGFINILKNNKEEI
jgi:8-oxo-dGTP pyrophosphatase MutT (NUDIX family)